MTEKKIVPGRGLKERHLSRAQEDSILFVQHSSDYQTGCMNFLLNILLPGTLR